VSIELPGEIAVFVGPGLTAFETDGLLLVLVLGLGWFFRYRLTEVRRMAEISFFFQLGGVGRRTFPAVEEY
jgi:hypothetical protein